MNSEKEKPRQERATHLQLPAGKPRSRPGPMPGAENREGTVEGKNKKSPAAVGWGGRRTGPPSRPGPTTGAAAPPPPARCPKWRRRRPADGKYSFIYLLNLTKNPSSDMTGTAAAAASARWDKTRQPEFAVGAVTFACCVAWRPVLPAAADTEEATGQCKKPQTLA